jgi:hypothetical protein
MISKSDLLFEQWRSSLANRDRRTPAIQGNFEELFEILKNEGLSLENAFEYLPKALKAHSPSTSLVKNMYRKLKNNSSFKWSSEKEFEEQWIKDISDRANTAFFNVFPIETKKNDEEDKVVIYGSMTAKEYKLQREYANEFPQMSTEQLEKQLYENYDPMEEVDFLFGVKSSGNSKR